MFKPTKYDEVVVRDQYETTTHRLNLTGREIDTVLYYLDQVANDIGEAYIPSPDVKRIRAELQSVTDNYYASKEGL